LISPTSVLIQLYLYNSNKLTFGKKKEQHAYIL